MIESQPSIQAALRDAPVHPRQSSPPSAILDNSPSEDAFTDSVASNFTPFPIIGIGASAGGLGAFLVFFSGLPADVDPGMSFVLVQHLAPKYKSLLSELIGRHIRLPVFEVQDGMRMQINCVYIIPPNFGMTLLHGVLHLHPLVALYGRRVTIDGFFKSLAADLQAQAIAIVLSGTGSDGTQGVRAIKDAGGMVMAQNLASCEFDGMPRSAIATGLVDYQLPPAEMPALLIAYVTHATRVPHDVGMAELTRTNSHVHDLLSGIGIGAVFVDLQLHILRFTPDASRIINLIPTDVGRPVAHIVSNLLDYNSLVADVQAVLNTLVPKEAEVKTFDGHWYSLRVQPYHTLDNVIEGAVISFVNVTEAVRTRESLHQANDLLRLAIQTPPRAAA